MESQTAGMQTLLPYRSPDNGIILNCTIKNIPILVEHWLPCPGALKEWMKCIYLEQIMLLCSNYFQSKEKKEGGPLLSECSVFKQMGPYIWMKKLRFNIQNVIHILSFLNLEISLYGSILLQRTPKITANNSLHVRLKKKSHFKEESKTWYAITVFQHNHRRKRNVLLQKRIYELASLMFIFWSITI